MLPIGLCCRSHCAGSPNDDPILTSPPTALFLSPHLDDVAFSATRRLGNLAVAGWQCVVLTIFTRSVPNPSGFALACQTDKGINPAADYMQIRRDEDAAYAATLNSGLSPKHPIEVLHGDLPEAPHRGYGDAPALFGDFRRSDTIASRIAPLINDVAERFLPGAVLAPAGYGWHVDHRQVIAAVRSRGAWRVTPRWWFYRDSPYVFKFPDARPAIDPSAMTLEPPETADWFGTTGLAAIERYATQLPFQFGGVAAMRRQMLDQPERHFAAG